MVLVLLGIHQCDAWRHVYAQLATSRSTKVTMVTKRLKTHMLSLPLLLTGSS